MPILAVREPPARKRNKHPSRLTPASVAPPSRAVRGVADLPTPPAATDERRPHLAQPPCPRLARLRARIAHTATDVYVEEMFEGRIAKVPKAGGTLKVVGSGSAVGSAAFAVDETLRLLGWPR